MLDSINVRTGMADSVLSEVAQHLKAFADEGTHYQIDVRSLPLSEGDRAELAKRLGRGEVSATVSVAGDSEVYETAYAGTWWVTHRSRDGSVLAEFIELTEVPALLLSHREDVSAAAKRLAEQLLRGEADHGE